MSLVATGCSLGGINTTSTPTTPPAPNETTSETRQPFTDISDIVDGICFEAAEDAAGQVFIIRDDPELSQFFDLADNSRLCRRPVERSTADFSNGATIIGLWSIGRGCTARHDLVEYTQNVTDRTIVIQLRFVTDGDCPYDLLRPFWVSIPNSTGYEFSVDVIS